jgi:hypothetical protein
MDRELQQICSVPSVATAFVCNRAGEVVAAASPAVLATVTMNHVGRAMSSMFDAANAAGRRGDRAELGYDTWRLIARDIGQALVLAVCHPGVDSAQVRMALDIAIVRWREDRKAQQRLAEHAARTSQGGAGLDDHALASWRLLAARG